MPDGRNLLLILSDEHASGMLGCYGHPVLRTPNLDALAGRGVRFAAACTNSPICIPARAALATGRYVHETRHWDNAMPYDGAAPSWGHRLRRAGIRVEAVGKLHFRGGGRDCGFEREIHPMHVMDGIGQVWGSVRDPLPPARPARMLGRIGPGESDYNRYDRRVADAAIAWLREAGARGGGRPWALQVGFVAPHFPLTVPEAFYGLYPPDRLPARKLDPEAGHARHPWIQRMDDFQQVDRRLAPAERRMAVAAYFGLCTYLDSLVGEVLDALAAAGLADRTCVVYTSDHGDNVGARGLWGKSNMYEESVGVPLIAAGPGIARGGGLPHAGLAARRLAERPGRGRAAPGRRGRGAARAVVVRPRRRALRPRPRGVRRIPRRGLAERGVHGPARHRQADPLCRLPARVLRPRFRSGGNGGPGRRPCRRRPRRRIRAAAAWHLRPRSHRPPGQGRPERPGRPLRRPRKGVRDRHPRRDAAPGGGWWIVDSG